MKGISSQIVGFIIGTLVLVLIIFVLGYAVSAFSKMSIEVGNKAFLNWIEGGASEAKKKGDWGAGNGKELADTGSWHYYLVEVNKDIYNNITSYPNCGEVDKGCYSADGSFKVCTMHPCLCLVAADVKVFRNQINTVNSKDEIYPMVRSNLSNVLENSHTLRIIMCKDKALDELVDEDGNPIFIKVKDDGWICALGSGKFEYFKLEAKDAYIQWENS